MKNFMKMILKYYYTVVVMALFILIMGLVTIAKTPIDIFPEINTPVVTAVWTYTGMSAKDIVRRIVTIEFADKVCVKIIFPCTQFLKFDIIKTG